jgi:hypothetical protein
MTHEDPDLKLRQLLADSHSSDEQRFAPGFADRVMRRVASEGAMGHGRGMSIESALARQARRLLPALLAASLALTVWNWWSLHDSVDSVFAAALGLQPVTVTTAMSSESLTGAEAFQ